MLSITTTMAIQQATDFTGFFGWSLYHYFAVRYVSAWREDADINSNSKWFMQTVWEEAMEAAWEGRVTPHILMDNLLVLVHLEICLEEDLCQWVVDSQCSKI